MSELERRLDDLGRHWDVPPTPDIAARVTTKLAHEQVATARRRPRRLTIALVAALVGAATVASIAPARDAILDFFSIGGATVKEVPTVPRAPAALGLDDLQLGREIATAAAATEVTFPVRLPSDLGAPSRAFVRTPPTGGMLSFVWDARDGLPRPIVPGVSVLMSQFPGTPFVEKLAASPSVEQLMINGEPAVWFSGPDHVVIYQSRAGTVESEAARLVGSALIWTDGTVTYRLEGTLTKERAIAVAKSLSSQP